MRAVVQRVAQCSVHADRQLCGHIDSGLLVYLGVGREDTGADLDYIEDKLVNLRIFPDEQDRMNLSAKDSGAEVLVVSQFTLFGDARKGRRPSYSTAADPEKALRYYLRLIENIRRRGLKVECGKFAAIMEVTYTNLGPVTILLDSEKKF